MRIVIAPDKFKGCLPAAEVAEAIATGVRAAIPQAIVEQSPVADGGEGTLAALLSAGGGKLFSHRVTGPLPEMKVDASYAMLADGVTAVIEMSAASGLSQLRPEDRDPLNTTTFGTGELIVAAIRNGAKRIILGLGGSATIDGGIGCLQACGFTILLGDGEPTSMTEPLCGRDLNRVLMIKHGRGEVTNGIEIIGACDVTIPLTGAAGAPAVFGPQKGATPQTVAKLDADLVGLVHRNGKRPQAIQPGAGAAGGLGFAVAAFFAGRLQSGFDLVAEQIHLRDRLVGADLCITGEGRLDSQTLHGKAVVGVARLCRDLNVPCVAIVGSVGEGVDELFSEGLTAYFSICDRPMSLDESQREGQRLLRAAAANCASLFTPGAIKKKSHAV